MKPKKPFFNPFLSAGLLLLFSACQTTHDTVNLGGSSLETIIIDKPALYPETLLYNAATDKFLVGSFRDGNIYEVDHQGNSKVFLEDERLHSVLGIEIDADRNRLLVVNADIGSGIRSYSEGPGKLAGLGIYELSSGRPLHYVELGQLRPQENHLGNGITLDAEGNAYVTDSFAPLIYKVDPEGNASVFLESERFRGEGINLNGIVYHPDDYLITVKKSEGILFKIPLSNPQDFTEIALDRKLPGGDGFLLVDPETLVLVSNIAAGVNTESAVSLKSTDNWSSARVLEEHKLEGVYPTTAAKKGDKIYALHSHLNVLNSSSREEQAELAHQATIQQIGLLNLPH